MTVEVTHLVVGPARHGVVSFALRLVESLERLGLSAPISRLDDWTDLGAATVPGTGLHLEFTDRLFGSTPGDAAGRVVGLVHRAAAAGNRVTATLHDVPQPSDGGNYLQRVAAYRAVCDALHGYATNSEHERSLLGEGGIADPADVVVVPLPLRIGATPEPRPSGNPPDVAVLGFVYPGKGHAEVLTAMAGLPPDVAFRAIGECSAGHDDLADHLATSARRSGRRFDLTGYVPDGELVAVLQRVSVPIAHHRHVSASGSLNSWIAAGRRPLAPESRYTIEHLGRHPGTLRSYPDTPRGLTSAIEVALDDPGSTWLAADALSGSTPTETARRYAETLARWHG